MASDTFTGTNLDPLSGSWGTAMVGDFQITGNQAQGTNGAGFSMKPRTADVYNADQEAEVLVNQGAASAAGPGIRFQTGVSASGYVISVYGTGSGNAEIQRMDSGANTSLSSAFTVVANTDFAKLRGVGTALTAYLNASGSASVTASDATYATGDLGIYAYLNGAVDTFNGGSVGAGGATRVVNAMLRLGVG